MTQSIIEKLEALQRHSMTYRGSNISHLAIKWDDLRAIIEDAKAEKQEPVGEIRTDKDNFKYIHWYQPWSHVLNCGNKLYTTPQPDIVGELVKALELSREKLQIECGGNREYKGGMPTQVLFPMIDALLAKAKEMMG